MVRTMALNVLFSRGKVEGFKLVAMGNLKRVQRRNRDRSSSLAPLILLYTTHAHALIDASGP